MLQAKECLDKAGNTRCSFQMPQIGFNRPNNQGAFRGSLMADRRSQSTGFDRIANRRSGTMGFYISNRGKIDMRLPGDFLNERALSIFTGHRQ